PGTGAGIPGRRPGGPVPRRGRGRRDRDLLPDDRERVLQPRLEGRRGDAGAPARARAPRRPPRCLPAARARRPFRSRARLAQPRSRVHARATRRRRQRHATGLLRSRSLPLRFEPALAERLPARRACRRRLRVAAAAHPPRDLGLPGRDDARDDAGDARRRARTRPPASRGRPDRLDMRPLTVLLTASGVPGSAALVRALRENGERELRLVGTDMSELAIGRHFCDAFHVVPAWRRVTGAAEVAAAARELGYPDEDVAFKPLVSSGSRGFRIVSAAADRRRQLLENRPGIAEALRLEELVELLGDDRTEALVMELARG